MTAQEKRKLYDYSIEFLRKSAHSKTPLTTADIPTPLIEFWLIHDFLANPLCTPNDYQYTIFVHAVTLFDSKQDKISSLSNKFRFYRMFADFQIILATVYLHRVNGKELKPVKLFDFSNYCDYSLNHNPQLFEAYKRVTKNIQSPHK